MQSRVWHALQIDSLRIFTVVGEINDPTKLNWPIGQTYLQKLAPRKKVSIRNAAPTYPISSHAVRAGLFHSANRSYPKKNTNISPTPIHFTRTHCGQRRRAQPSRRPSSRGNVNGQAMQKRLPTNRSAST